MKRLVFAAGFVLLALFSVVADPGEAGSFSGEKTDWCDGVFHEFTFKDKNCVVILPEKPGKDRPWIWHGTYFFFKKDKPRENEMLKNGMSIVYIKTGMFPGCPEEVKLKNEFYDYVTEKFKLNKKAALLGLSAGGMSSYKWALENPEKVACIYVDNPVCDFKSWPAGLGKSRVKKGLQGVMKVYGFKTEEEALTYKGNPVDNMATLVKADVPILVVVAGKDTVVPMEENSALVEKTYRALGGTNMTVIHKPDADHHPHGLKDRTPITDFIVKHTK
ncbi:alpha/beta hydrolase family protein [Verrucomicrobiota bacterium]